MGSIKRFNLPKLIETFKTSFFFETGTGMGESLSIALKADFRKIISSEIITELVDKARYKFRDFPSVKIVNASSIDAFKEELPSLKGSCIFWLDAHFPGADAGLAKYDEEIDEAIRLPLESELNYIRLGRANYNDVIIIDDLRIYEDGAYENGNAPLDAQPKFKRDISFVYEMFSKTHTINKLLIDEGYIVLLPENEQITNGLDTYTNKEAMLNEYLF